MNDIVQNVFRWVNDNAIIHVQDFDAMPSYSQYVLNHVHENGVCRKHRFGPKCGVDSETHT